MENTEATYGSLDDPAPTPVKTEEKKSEKGLVSSKGIENENSAENGATAQPKKPRGIATHLVCAISCFYSCLFSHVDGILSAHMCCASKFLNFVFDETFSIFSRS
jgi:hypothetical protein